MKAVMAYAAIPMTMRAAYVWPVSRVTGTVVVVRDPGDGEALGAERGLADGDAPEERDAHCDAVALSGHGVF